MKHKWAAWSGSTHKPLELVIIIDCCDLLISQTFQCHTLLYVPSRTLSTCMQRIVSMIPSLSSPGYRYTHEPTSMTRSSVHTAPVIPQRRSKQGKNGMTAVKQPHWINGVVYLLTFLIKSTVKCQNSLLCLGLSTSVNSSSYLSNTTRIL